jgi:hypothetical protein
MPPHLDLQVRWGDSRALKGFGDFKIGEKHICTVKQVDDLNWLRKKWCYRA